MRYTATAAAMAALLAFAPSAHAEGFRFVAGLSGDQEVSPPAPEGGVDTKTSGSIRLRFDGGLTEARYVLRVRRGEKITQAHLHCAVAGKNGPIVAFLFKGADSVAGPGGVDVNGVLARGVLDNFDIEVPDIPFEEDERCGVPINNIASLLAAVLGGNIYVNVHSEGNPPGEVRGQIFAGSRGAGGRDDDRDKDGDKDND